MNTPQASLLALAAFALATPAAYALNYNELEVYPYATAQPREIEIENRFTYTQQGRRDVDAPDNHQGMLRDSTEFVYGFTERTEGALYFDYERPKDGAWSHTGQRLRLRHRFAEKGEYPVDFGLYLELERPYHEDNTLETDIQVLMEKDFGKWTFNLNPAFGKVLRGVEKSEGWGFGYSAAVIYRLNETWRPRLDFFGDLGPLSHFSPRAEQVHLISPAVDMRLGHGFKAGLGVAFGLTQASEKRLIRARVEYEF